MTAGIGYIHFWVKPVCVHTLCDYLRLHVWVWALCMCVCVCVWERMLLLCFRAGWQARTSAGTDVREQLACWDSAAFCLAHHPSISVSIARGQDKNLWKTDRRWDLMQREEGIEFKRKGWKKLMNERSMLGGADKERGENLDKRDRPVCSFAAWKNALS